MRQRSLTIAHRLHPVPRIAAALAAASFLGLVAGSASAQKAAAEEEDLSVEGLYRTASELAIEGKFEESAAKFEKLFDLVGDLLCEDYGPQSGGIVFDYGNALIQLQRWADARDAFQRCHTFSKTECAKSKIPGENTREKLALFQWGFCEAQLGNHEQALQLYDQYLAAKPDPAELAKIRNGFKLRYGTSLVKVGKLAEGSAAITELFDNREAWQVTPQFLMQGLLELGLGWVENAQKASTPAQIAEIEKSANLFLDKNAAFVAVQPVESFRYGFIDRMKKLGLECARSGLGGLSIRFFSMVPSLDEVMQDAESRVIFNAGYQQIVDQVKEQMGKPIPPDFEVLKILGMAYEKLGNAIAAREIYWQLAEDYPDVDKEQRAEVLHEAARFSAQMGDYSAAQYFGEVFVSEMPEDHKLRNNISVFMLQSLFTMGQYEAVITVCNDVRTRFELGDEKRELADAYLGLALYVLGRHQEAQDVLDEFAKTYKESGNREMVMYHRASNRLILGEFRKGADLLTEFLAEFPKSERYADRALGDLALARFNLEDYDAAIAAVDQLAAEFPDSVSMDRALNIKGDCLLVKSDEAEEDADKEKIRQEALDVLLAAIDTGKKLQAAANEQAAP
ncbi:MAG: tetratricopeptide repeat protein, partial [Verrucomicrobiae bacterium]|nr:tetratricopeptide repeat protein [Verrucomicrobiae bacterium]